MKRYAFFVFLAAFMAFGDSAFGQALTRGPYLQSSTYNSLIVRWRTSTSTDSRVRYGTSLANLNQLTDVTQSTTEHIVQLTGLSMGTQYYYSIGSTSAVLAGGDASHFFVTSPPPGTFRPTRIWVLGDSGTADANARAVRDSYFTFAGSTYTDLILMLGDNAYNSGTDAEYQAAVFNTYPAILQKSPLWATLGNHDGLSADSLTQTGPFYNIFSFPKNGEAGGLPSGTEAYFSFEFGNIHFINLESFETDRSSGGAMMTWLRNDLAQNTKQWTIAFWHHPPYTKGSHDSDSETELIEMRQIALPILEAGGVDLVLTGHSHAYERSFLIDGHYGFSNTFTSAMKKNAGDGRPSGTGAYVKPSAAPAPHEGAVYAVAGSSGQTSGGPLNYPAMFISLNQLGSMVLDINGNRLDARFLTSGGASPDTFTITKGGPPSAPTALAASAVSGSQINLAWTDNSNNEDSFLIESSTDGVNYSQLTTTAANATTFHATGLLAGTLYYFRVTAANIAYGNSGPSNVASATTASGTAPSLTSISPAAGTQGSSVPVTLTGTNFTSGATVSVSGTGVTATNVAFVDASGITATLTVAANAAPGPRNVTVTTVSGTSNAAAFTVNSASLPAITSVNPSSGLQGQTVPITITGTNFLAGATVGVGGTGVAAGSVVVVNGTSITATLTIAASAATGSHNLTVTTASGTSNTVSFTVNPATGGAPTITGVSPGTGSRGQIVPVTITGTNFLAGATVGVKGAGVTQGNFVVVSSTQMTATFTISATAVLGTDTVTVTTSAGVSNTFPFNVTAASGPAITSISPAVGALGQTVPVTITGSGFVTGATVGVSGTGITATNTVVVNSTSVTASFAITAGAATGVRNVTVTTSGGTSNAVTFTANPPAPAISGMTPASGVQGQTVPVTITGSNFVAGATVGVSGTGITANNVVVVNGTSITASLTIASGAVAGNYNVTVTTAGGTSNAVTFTANAAVPAISGISPASGIQGQTVPVTIVGSNFISGATVAVSGTGITASNIVVVNSTSITASLAIAPGAATGSYTVTVTTAGGTSNAVTFTANAAVPVISGISPASGVLGQTVPVTITGFNFVSGATVGVSGTGITASNVVVVNGTSITASLTVAAGAALGARNVTVTTSGGTSNAVTFTANPAGGGLPTITSISPVSSPRGQTVLLTITGTNFLPGATVGVKGIGVTQGNFVVLSSTQMTAVLTISPTAVLGADTVTVRTTAGVSNGVTFTVQ